MVDKVKKTLVDVLQQQVISLTEQVRTMSQSYEDLIEGEDKRTATAVKPIGL